jgi:hypothetical protein
VSAFEERVRGARAAQILNDDVYKQAIEATQGALIDRLINIDPFDPEAPTMALRGVMRIQALTYVIQSLGSVMTTGEMAAEEGEA